MRAILGIVFILFGILMAWEIIAGKLPAASTGSGSGPNNWTPPQDLSTSLPTVKYFHDLVPTGAMQ